MLYLTYCAQHISRFLCIQFCSVLFCSVSVDLSTLPFARRESCLHTWTIALQTQIEHTCIWTPCVIESHFIPIEMTFVLHSFRLLLKSMWKSWLLKSTVPKSAVSDKIVVYSRKFKIILQLLKILACERKAVKYWPKLPHIQKSHASIIKAHKSLIKRRKIRHASERDMRIQCEKGNELEKAA